MLTRTEYIDGTNLQLDLWGDQFSSLERKLKQSGISGHKQLKRKLDTLKDKKRTLQLRLREAAHGSTNTEWEDVREPLEKAVEDFRSLAVEVYDNVKGA